jgi:hypothetical protein
MLSILAAGGPMRLRFRPLWLAAATLTLASGCAIYDTRYDYARLAAGIGDYQESIIDWNFPTSANQGPLLPPERIRWTPPAIGVPWATSDPLPWANWSPALDGSAQAETAHEADARCEACDVEDPADDAPDLRADARLRERLLSR